MTPSGVPPIERRERLLIGGTMATPSQPRPTRDPRPAGKSGNDGGTALRGTTEATTAPKTVPGAHPNRGSGPRRGACPGIVRVHLPPLSDGRPREAYRATARLCEEARQRLFADEDHGGPDEALAAARAWRGRILADAGLADPPNRRVVLKPKSSSGVVGVYRREPTTGRAGTAVWVATYGTSSGETKSRSFSVGKFGEQEALDHALDQRRQWETDDLGRPITQRKSPNNPVSATAEPVRRQQARRRPLNARRRRGSEARQLVAW